LPFRARIHLRTMTALCRAHSFSPILSAKLPPQSGFVDCPCVNKTGHIAILPGFSWPSLLRALLVWHASDAQIHHSGFGAAGSVNGRLLDGMAETPKKVFEVTTKSPH